MIHAGRESGGDTQGTPVSGWARRDGIAFAAWGCRARSTLEGQCKVGAWDSLSLRIMRVEVAC